MPDPADGTALPLRISPTFTTVTAINGQKGRVADGTAADGEYYGTWKELYVIGIDSSATFLNDYEWAPKLRVPHRRYAALQRQHGRAEQHCLLIPAYLVNADAATIAKYKAAPGDLWIESGKTVYFDQDYPVRKVIVAEDMALKDAVKDTFDQIFKRTWRIRPAEWRLQRRHGLAQHHGDCALPLGRRMVFDRIPA